MLPLLWFALSVSGAAEGRDCPSRLSNHAMEVTDSLWVGVEARAVGLAISPGDHLLEAREVPDLDLALLAGVRGLLEYEPTESLLLVFEPEVRYKRPGWDHMPVAGLKPFRPNQAFLQLQLGSVGSRLGVQHLDFGSTALLDTRALAGNVEYSGKNLKLSAFAGMTTRTMLRNGDDCLYYRYLAGRMGWKTTMSTRPWENYLAGATAGFKGPWESKARFLYLAAITERDATRSHAASASLSGPILASALSYHLEPVAWFSSDVWMPGAVALLRWRAWDSESAPRGQLGAAAALGSDEDRRMRPVYENLSWGYLRRYSLHDGYVGLLRAHWPISRAFRPILHYQAQTLSPRTGIQGDELDLGVEYSWKAGHSLRVSLAALDLAAPPDPSLGGWLELRIIALGSGG